MEKMILYKEWIKTRWFIIGSFLVLATATAYTLLNLAKGAQFNGNSFLWVLVAEKGSVLIDQLKSLPFILGGLLAIAQMLPEVSGKRLKLTLHLPYPQHKMVFMMYMYGIGVLAAMFLIQAIAIHITLCQWIISDLAMRILRTSAAWYLAGLASYIWIAAVCLEPVWKMRIILLLLLARLTHLLFISSIAESYNSFLPWLTIYVLAGQSLIFHSIGRFKEGVQD